MRLTKSLRETIVRKAIESTFKERVAELAEVWTGFADEVYMHVCGNYLVAINSLPDGFFRKEKTFQVFLGEERHPQNLTMTECRRIPHVLSHYYSSQSLRIEDKKIVSKYVNLAKKNTRLEEDKDTLKRTLNGVVNSVTTVKKLQDVWPECSPFIPAWAKEEKNLPAVVADDVNQLIQKMKSAA